MHKKHVVTAATILIFCLFWYNTASAAEINDGFKTAKKIESRYFKIFLEEGVNTQSLVMRISVPPAIKGIIKKPVDFADSYTLSNQLDLLYLAVCEIMDVRLKKFKCDIKICKDTASLNDISSRFFGRPIRTGGFYAAQLNTLYIDAENVDINILGHELSHAVQCNYFIVPPPAKLQEVLAGYVEFTFRKYTGSLPR